MTKKSDIKRDNLRSLAIDKAWTIVQQKGFSELNARIIAKKIGCSVGTLYNIFENLDELVLFVNGRTLDSMHDYMKNEKTVNSLARSYIDYANKEPNLWATLFEHRTTGRDNLPKWYQEKIDLMFDLTEKILENSLDTDQKTLRRTAKVIWASIHGICALSLSGTLNTTKSDSAHVLANSMIDNYLGGLKS